ncbi:pre-RNA processing PIH1/Nop17-domain-containing protein [Geranomyces variabilis]|nr:pre-RNA processing PIH1/Nop17-domain-containing protein [Geranomyces variabilis]KAJ3142139.1 PIH1 domain-containing protein 2 [Geranomyces variabilis]
MPAPNEAADQAAHVWKQLDAMYAKSPKDYKTFISALHREAEDLGIDNPLERIVRGRFCIKSAYQPPTRQGQQRRWYVNLCESARVKPAKDAQGDVSVVMSKARTGVEEDDSSPYDVYDAVVNPAIIREAHSDTKFRTDLIELALGCVEESFGVKLDRTGIKITNDLYKGLYGWDDARGRPLKQGVEPAQPPDPFGTAPKTTTTMTPQSLLARVRGNGSDNDGDDDDEGDSISRDASREALLRVPRKNVLAPAAGAIQDLATITPYDGDDDSDADTTAVEPRHVEGRRDDGSWVLEVQLPARTTASHIEATVLYQPPPSTNSSSKSSSTISIKTQSCRLTRSIPTDANATLARARFLARCSVLQISVPPRDKERT